MDDNELNEELEVDQELETDEVYETEEEVVETEEVKEETVPLKKYLAMKKEKKMLQAELDEAKFDSEIKDYKKKVVSRYSEKGFDPDLADLIAQDLAEMKLNVSKVGSINKVDAEISELAADPLYKNIQQYKVQVKAAMKEKGLTAELAYISVRGGVNAILRESKVEADLTPKTVETEKAPSSNTSSGINTNQKLDSNDKKALKNLQQYQPNAGWTVEKYLKMRG